LILLDIKMPVLAKSVLNSNWFSTSLKEVSKNQDNRYNYYIVR
jgi:hypothetical protein